VTYQDMRLVLLDTPPEEIPRVCPPPPRIPQDSMWWSPLYDEQVRDLYDGECLFCQRACLCRCIHSNSALVSSQTSYGPMWVDYTYIHTYIHVASELDKLR
jgi:hypothetical protein